MDIDLEIEKLQNSMKPLKEQQNKRQKQIEKMNIQIQKTKKNKKRSLNDQRSNLERKLTEIEKQIEAKEEEIKNLENLKIDIERKLKLQIERDNLHDKIRSIQSSGKRIKKEKAKLVGSKSKNNKNF